MNIKKTFLFYDIETSGLNPCFNQVLQFAAIRTDLNFHEIERHEINVRLNIDTLIEPGALITHRIPIASCQKGQSELAAIINIHQLLNTPGTISIGYNSLGFDDEFLRFGFFRHLLSPYTHQYANQCQRMDLFPVTMMFYLFQPDALPKWPTDDKGQVRLKLELLNECNQLAVGAAHQAIVDVEATLALAKQFAQFTEMWRYLLENFDKTIDEQRCQSLKSSWALLANSKAGMKNNFLTPVIYCGPHQQYKNQHLWLRLDYEDLTKLNFDNIAENTFAFRKKWGENEFLLPKKPHYLEKISKKRLKLTEKNVKWLQENPERWQEIKNYHCQYMYPIVPNLDIEAALYATQFMSDATMLLCKRFHQAKPADKFKLAENLPNPYQQLALHLLVRYFPEQLPVDVYQKIHHQLLYQGRVDFRGQKKLSIAECQQKIENLILTELDVEQKNLLQELQVYLNQFQSTATIA